MPHLADERPHDPAGPGWVEAWYLDFSTPLGELAGFACLELQPARRRAAYSAAVVGADRRPVVIVDHDVPLLRDRRIELRTSGLWTDLTVETPGEHVTYGLEAIGVALDHPDDALAGLRGDPTPVGFDLEWETEPVDLGVVPSEAGGYLLACRVTGEVLVADEAFDLDAWGVRVHRWGPDREPDWWWGRHDDGTWTAGVGRPPSVAPEPTARVPVPTVGPDGAEWVVDRQTPAIGSLGTRLPGADPASSGGVGWWCRRVG